MLVRVEMGVSYDHATSRTANSTTNSGRPIQLAPFASKFHQSSVIDDVVTRGSGSDDPNDTFSERKLIPNRYTGT